MKKTHVAAAAAVVFASTLVFAAGDSHNGKMEACMKAALAKHPGTVLSMEAEVENGKAVYEFDIKGKDGKEWEVECDAATAKIIEEEMEVSAATDAAFKAKISLEEARKIALAKFPGEVIESEFGVESDGMPVYEFDIQAADGTEMEVEVDAATGKIVESEKEAFQVGMD